jgi:hypothetical protein
MKTSSFGKSENKKATGGFTACGSCFLLFYRKLQGRRPVQAEMAKPPKSRIQTGAECLKTLHGLIMNHSPRFSQSYAQPRYQGQIPLAREKRIFLQEAFIVLLIKR